jgi:hypothetical protein
MSTLRNKIPTMSKAAVNGRSGRSAGKKKFSYYPATAREIQRAVGVTKKQLAIARELLASVRASRVKTG